MSDFHYTTSVYFNDSIAYKRIEHALNIYGAFGRRRGYDADNNYGEYVSEHYRIALDGDMAFINFKEPNLDYIASIVNPILSAFFQPRGAYEVRHIETDDVIYDHDNVIYDY